MACEMRDEVIPAFKALWRRDVLLVPEGMKSVGVERELPRHEADFDNGPDAALEEPVVDFVDIREVVDGIAVFVFVVNADFVMKDGVKANVLKAGGLFHGD